MTHGHDLLCQIAHARAQLMMRGHPALLVIIGRAALARLQREAYPYAPHEDLIIDMPYELRDDVEGFLVVSGEKDGWPCGGPAELRQLRRRQP